MGPRGTRTVAGAVAAGLILAGVTVDRRRGTRPLATISGVAAAVGYVVATFFPRTRLFGAPARVVPAAGLFALTFDDGPDPRHTPAISRILAERGHQATFFVLGRAVRAHPEATRAVLECGNEIACHGDDHRLLGFAPPGSLRRQIGRAESAILAATGKPPAPLFRRASRCPQPVAHVRRRASGISRLCLGRRGLRHRRARRRDDRRARRAAIAARGGDPAPRRRRVGSRRLPLPDRRRAPRDTRRRGASRPPIRRSQRTCRVIVLPATGAAVTCVEVSSRRTRPARTGASAAVASVPSTAPAAMPVGERHEPLVRCLPRPEHRQPLEQLHDGRQGEVGREPPSGRGTSGDPCRWQHRGGT